MATRAFIWQWIVHRVGVGRHIDQRSERYGN